MARITSVSDRNGAMLWDQLKRFALLTVALVETSGAPSDSGAGCTSDVLARSVSPTGAWTTVLRRDVCSDGAFTTVVSDVVQVGSVRSPGRAADVFGLDEGGYPEDRPVVKWTGPDTLQITAPNLALIGLYRSRFDEVSVELRFDPDDPAAREAFQ